MNKFTENFDQYVCAGDYIQLICDDRTYYATVKFDDFANLDFDDMHNVDLCETDKQRQQVEAIRQAWRNDEWFYGIVELSCETDDGWRKTYQASAGGIEINYPIDLIDDTRTVNNDYLLTVANELLAECIDDI